MLKWLVQRVPDHHHPNSSGLGLPDLITDDPLAVLDLDNKKQKKEGEKDRRRRNLVKRGRKNKKREIYSVNRCVRNN